VLGSTVSFATPLLLIKHTTGRPTCSLQSASYLGWKTHKMSQTGFYSNFSAALVKVGLKVWSSIFRPYVCFLPAYTANACLLLCPGHYVFKVFILIFLNASCLVEDVKFKTVVMKALRGYDAVLSSINILTFQINLLLVFVRSLSYPEEGCSSFPKGR